MITLYRSGPAAVLQRAGIRRRDRTMLMQEVGSYAGR